MLKRIILISFLTYFISAFEVEAVMYECVYKNQYGTKVVSSFDPSQTNRSDYNILSEAFRKGKCTELRIKKYFLDGASCNLQFYRGSKKVTGMSCYGKNRISALNKLKAIAKEEYNY